MFIDALLRLSDAQAVTADAASTNTIDLGNVTPKRKIGSGEPMGVLFAVDVAADFTTEDEAYELQVIQSANADLSSPTIIATLTLTAAQLVAGAMFVLPIPPGFPTARYLGAYYNVGGTTPTVTITADLMPLSMAHASIEQYAKNYSI